MSTFPVSQFRLLWELSSFYASDTEYRPVSSAVEGDQLYHLAWPRVRLDAIWNTVDQTFGSDGMKYGMRREHWLTWLGCEVGVFIKWIPAREADPKHGIRARPALTTFEFYHTQTPDAMTEEEVASQYGWIIFDVRRWRRQAIEAVQAMWEVEEAR